MWPRISSLECFIHGPQVQSNRINHTGSRLASSVWYTAAVASLCGFTADPGLVSQNVHVTFCRGLFFFYLCCRTLRFPTLNTELLVFVDIAIKARVYALYRCNKTPCIVCDLIFKRSCWPLNLRYNTCWLA